MNQGISVVATNLSHGYGRGRGHVSVLRGLDLEIPAGSHVALQGPSGAGKSTLLGLVGGLEPPRGGELRVGDTNLSSLRGRALARYRRRTVGFVFQHFGLVDVLTARENVVLALSLDRVSRSERRRRADELLDEVGLRDRVDHRPSQLSGGERQRVAIARALANRPVLLLADEPTGNLDAESTVRVLDMLERFRRQRGCTLVIVTHNEAVAERAHVRLQLRDGMVRA